MDARLTRLLYGSYAGILITLIGGALIMPGVFLRHPHNGISFWGNYFPAVIPYSVGLTTTATLMFYAAYVMPGRPSHLAAMRRLLTALAFGLVLILATPEGISPAFYLLHMLAAVYLYLTAGVGAIWIIMRDGKSRLDRILFWVLMLGSAMSLFSLSYIHLLGVLAFGQVLALNAGVLIIIRATLRWSGQKVKE